MELIRTDGVIKNHDRFKLGPVDLSLSQGEALGIMGPAGAGKTTLTRLMWGFLRPDEGDISMLLFPPYPHYVTVRRAVGYLPAEPRFYEWMTPLEHFDFVSKFYFQWIPERAMDALERLGIDPKERIYRMSAGDRRKVALAAAVAHNPVVLLLDEPTTGVEFGDRADILAFVRHFLENPHVGAIVCSDISEDLDKLATVVLMLNAGRVVEYGTVSALANHYGHDRMEAIFREASARRDNRKKRLE